jgi:hypothetical protein
MPPISSSRSRTVTKTGNYATGAHYGQANA